MIVSGKNAVLEVLTSKLTIERIYFQKDQYGLEKIIDYCKQSGIKYTFVGKDFLDKQTSKHQGVVAICSEFVYSTVEDILEVAKEKNKPNFVVLLANIEDVNNLASIIRVCECAGVDGILIPKNNCASVNETVMRVSAGAASHIKIAKVTNLNAEIEKLKKQNIWVFGAEASGENLYQTNLKGNVAIVIGGENTGIPKLMQKNCDKIVSIPMSGKINSLNASVACGIVLYEVVRQNI